MAVYLVGKPGEVGGRMVSTAHLVPYIKRRVDLRVPEEVDEQVEDNVEQVGDNVDNGSVDDAMAQLNDDELRDEPSDGTVEEEEPIADGIRLRPQRNVRRPAWLNDFDTS